MALAKRKGMISEWLHNTATAITSDDAGAVDAVDKIVDTGGGRISANMRISVTAITTSAGDEVYAFELQGSSSSSFASTIVPLGGITLGAATALQGDTASAVGVYNIPVTNEYAGTIYQYLRVNLNVSGSSPSVIFNACLTT